MTKRKRLFAAIAGLLLASVAAAQFFGIPRRVFAFVITSTLTVEGESTFNDLMNLSEAAPNFQLRETGVAADEGNWRMLANTTQLQWGTLDDALAVGSPFLSVNRTGTTVDTVNLQGTDVQVNGVSVGGTVTRIAGNSGAAGADLTWQNLTGDASNSTTTFSTFMTTTGVGAGTWKFKYTVIFQDTVALGRAPKFAINHTGTVGDFVVIWFHVTTGTTAGTGVTDNVTTGQQLVEGKATNALNGSIGQGVGIQVADVNVMAIIEGIMVVTATGSIEAKFAQNSGISGTLTLKADTLLELAKIE